LILLCQKIKISTQTFFLWLILLALIVCNFLLIRQNLQLKADIKDLIAEQKIQVGAKFSEFKGVNLENNQIAFTYNQNKLKKIILYSSANCPFCKQQNPYWTEVIKQIDNQKYEVLELFRDREDKSKVASYLNANGYELENSSVKFLFLADEFLQENKLNSTPTTLLVNENGIVEKVWFGLWDKTIISEVNSSLGVSVQYKG